MKRIESTHGSATVNHSDSKHGLSYIPGADPGILEGAKREKTVLVSGADQGLLVKGGGSGSSKT